jgi:heme A synthase
MALPQYGKLYIYEDSMVQIAHRVLLTVVSSVLLLVPVGVLSSIKDKGMAVIIVALCCLLMAVVMAAATGCRDHEIIMATSA